MKIYINDLILIDTQNLISQNKYLMLALSQFKKYFLRACS
jgi:hypothetical protein